jgi:L-alanine-DL-glutamate epimerase-like enolase superfamily enzyme
MHTPTLTKIEIFKFNLPWKQPLRVSLGFVTTAHNILIRLHTADGLIGLGEAAPLSFISGGTQATDFEAGQALARLLIGQDPLAVEARLADMDRFLVHNHTIKSAFDMALYDVAAKHARLPLYAFLGGEKRRLSTVMTIGIDTPEAMAREAVRVKAQGFHVIKVKLGEDRGADVSRMRAIRAAVGDDAPIRIDANQGWDPVTAIAILNDLAPLNIHYCEEPVAHWDNTGLRRVRERSPIPIMADESLFDHHDAFRLAAMGACDYFNIKLAKSGGIHTALKINAIAEGAGIPCQMGCMAESRLGLSAAAHLISARPNIRFPDLDASFFHGVDPVVGGITFGGGWIELPDAPGLGADIDPAFLKQMESVTIG